jgi:hypothetical protein
MFAAWSCDGTALAQPDKPRVPPGRHPGGVMVAIATPIGLDYTHPQIAPRLARDGEGELIGWDFQSNDRLPYAPLPAAPDGRDPTSLAAIVLREAGATSLVPVRTPKPSLMDAPRTLVFLAQTPARIVLCLDAGGRRADWETFAAAASHFKQLLIVVPAARKADAAYPAAWRMASMLVVGGAHVSGGIIEPLYDPAGVDVLVEAASVPALIHGGREKQLSGHAAAAARVAALAARLVADAPDLDAHGLKRRILSLSAPLPAGAQGGLRVPFIAEPQRHFRPE